MDEERGATAAAEALVAARLVDDRRSRAARSMTLRDSMVSAAGASVFVVAAVVLASVADVARSDLLLAAAFVAAYAVVSRVEFEVGSGTLVPTELVLVPMLFVLPPALTPALVGLALLAGAVPELVSGRMHPERVLVTLHYGTHALGPAVVLTAAGVSDPRWVHWPWLVLALVAQFALDALGVVARERFALCVPVRTLAPVVLRVYAMDALLAPVGLLAALAADESRWAFVAVLPLAVLFHLLAVDRRHGIDQAVSLTGAVAEATRAARVDSLTGLHNRLAWEEELLRLRAETLAPVSFVLVDVDGLKRVNDSLGHDAGDVLIRTVGIVVDATLGQEASLVARIGGDEFACALPGVEEAVLDVLVARLQRAFDGHGDVGGAPVSASVGGATATDGPEIERALELADQRSYDVKRARGRLRPAV